jgi:uncharacterized protein (DUF433 family)
MNGRYSLNLPINLKKEAELFAKHQGISLNQMILWSLAEKITQLKDSMVNSKYPSIYYKFNSTGMPIPCTGNGMRVQTIIIAHTVWKETVRSISRDYDIPESLVQEALKYYEENKKYIDGLIADNDQILADPSSHTIIVKKPPSQPTETTND